jgi:hypothetical protein
MANDLRFDWPGIHPASLGGEGGGLAGAKLLANLLAMPEETYQSRVGASQARAVARAMGVPEDQLDIVAPGEDVPTPVGGTGITGKIMSGVGHVGATLSSILGAPIKPPRFGPTELKDLEEGTARQSLIGTLDPNDPDYAKKAAKIRLGKYDEVFPGMPKNAIELTQQEADRRGLTGRDRYDFIANETARIGTGLPTQQRVDITTQADIDKKNAEIDKQNEGIRQWNKDHPEAQRPEIPHLSVGAGGAGGGTGDTGGTGGGGAGAASHYGKFALPTDPVPEGKVSPYDPRFDAAADKYGHPRGLLNALAENESNFDPKAIGPPVGQTRVQARGLMQFMPGTAGLYDLKDPHDAGASIDAAGRLLRHLVDANNGDYNAALLQYGGATHGNYPAAAILQRAAQYRDAVGRGGGQPPTQPPTQVAANVPPDTTSDVGSPGAIGIPDDALTDQKGNVYNRSDPSKPIGKVVPNQPGKMIVQKETMSPTGRTTEVVDPTAPFQADKQRNMAIAQLHQEQAGGAAVDPNDERQIYDRMARNAQGMRGFTEADAAEASVGHKPGEPWTADQANKVLMILKNKGGETGPQAALARITLQRADNALLMQPVQKTDPNTGQALKDQYGRPVYAMWTDPSDGIKKPIRPVDVAMTNWMVAHAPFAAQINMQQMTNDPDFHLAAMMLNQAQSNLTRWATLKGDAKRIADTERVRMATMVPQIGDTKQQAIDKITLGNQALDRMEKQARNELAMKDVIPESPTAAPAPQTAPAPEAPRAAAPPAKAGRTVRSPRDVTISDAPMGQQ